MKLSKPRGHPEKKLEHAVRNYLHSQGWYTVKMHGNKFQSGIPDLYCAHPKYGQRWIELKTRDGVMTSAQCRTFPKFHKAGVKIFIIGAVSDIGTPGSNKGIFGSKSNWLPYMNKKNRFLILQPLDEDTIR